MIKLNEKTAELIGVIIGDGCIRYKPKINQYYIEIVGNKNEENEYFDYLSEIFRKELNLKPTINVWGRGLRMKIYSKYFVEFLVNDLELPFNKEKCKNIFIPSLIIDNEQLLKSCLKGIVDTDGSLFLANKGYRKEYPTIEISTISKRLAQQINDVLSKEYRIGFRKYKPKNFSLIFRISLNGDVMVDKWFNQIGFSNPRNINRYRKLKNGNGGI